MTALTPERLAELRSELESGDFSEEDLATNTRAAERKRRGL